MNIVAVTRSGGTEQLVENVDSIDEFGSRQNTLTDTLNVSDTDALSVATQRLAQFENTFQELRVSYKSIRKYKFMDSDIR